MNLLVVIDLYEKKYHSQISLSEYISFLQTGIALLNKEQSHLQQEEEKALKMAMEYSSLEK